MVAGRIAETALMCSFLAAAIVAVGCSDVPIDDGAVVGIVSDSGAAPMPDMNRAVVYFPSGEDGGMREDSADATTDGIAFTVRTDISRIDLPFELTAVLPIPDRAVRGMERDRVEPASVTLIARGAFPREPALFPYRLDLRGNPDRGEPGLMLRCLTRDAGSGAVAPMHLQSGETVSGAERRSRTEFSVLRHDSRSRRVRALVEGMFYYIRPVDRTTKTVDSMAFRMALDLQY